ncbi:MAG: lipoprotein-anchoring transpeptidase ErfK/SrfK [Chlamydiales bacterium]|jgi:lipoprotein-anchoring transpeptidase ErfK/SrfK
MTIFRSLTLSLIFLSSSLFGEEISGEFYSRLSRSGYSMTKQLLVVSVSEQKIKVFTNGKLKYSYTISTAKNGIGQEVGSGQTPLGLHRVSEKFGYSSAPDTIFVGRQSTGRKWVLGSGGDQDLILTRILWLEGLEQGYNAGLNSAGKSVDSRKRMIYIHGTNHEELLGKPVSKGCIRMEKNDVLAIFERVPNGSLVWIES